MKDVLRKPWWKRLTCLEVALAVCVIALGLQLLPEVIRMWEEWPRPGRQTPSRAALNVEGQATEVKYLVYLPEDYARHSGWPLLLYLHGSGARGDDLDVLLHCDLPRRLAAGEQLPMIAVCPQCRDHTAWDAQQLLALIDHVEDRFSVDPERIYVAGYSMGGYGTWSLAAAAPDRFAAAIPICGGGDVRQANRLVDLPIWAFHGAKDTTVPLRATMEMIEAIRKLGGKPQLTVFPDEGHAICDTVLGRSDLFAWLLGQRRQQKPYVGATE